MDEMSDLELLRQLGVDTTAKKKASRSPKEERIIAGFEEIQRFVEKAGHLPEHGEGKDIFERLYAVRLEQIRKQPECRELLSELDDQGLLGGTSFEVNEPEPDSVDDEELLARLGIEAPHEGEVTFLKHVKTRAEVRAAEEIASRTACKDFDKFKAIFKTVQEEVEQGIRETEPFRDFAEIREGDLFILAGQKVYVAEVGALFINQNDKKDARLRVIYDNGTESDILLRSLQRALNKDDTGRRIVEKLMLKGQAGTLFSGIAAGDDQESGTIYVLRSLSDHPIIAENREVIHKIGVTGGCVRQRTAHAKSDPTFLMADVEVVAKYELFNINRSKLEHLLHKFFSAARLNIEINDRFGQPVVPREWFLVPLFVIDELVEKLKEGTVALYEYDKDAARLRLRA